MRLLRFAPALIPVLGLLFSTPSHAQGGTEMVNCAGLKGLPALCFKNASPVPIVAIQASNSMSWGSDWIPIPGTGVIQPSGTSIIRFPTGFTGCSKYLEVKKADGTAQPINGGRAVNVCDNTSVIIRW